VKRKRGTRKALVYFCRKRGKGEGYRRGEKKPDRKAGGEGNLSRKNDCLTTWKKRNG